MQLADVTPHEECIVIELGSRVFSLDLQEAF
jgi:hypothetical protein